MNVLRVMFEEGVDPARSLATDRYFLESFRRRRAAHEPVLRLYTAPGDVLSLGRFHRVPPGRSRSDVRILRRLSGGRAIPFGEGFLGFSLLLPHRSALVSDEPFAVAPYQVPSRYVRGVLEGLRRLGLDPYYPGRDFVSIDRRVVASMSFESDDAGGFLFEGIVALDRDFGILSSLLSAADPKGELQGETLEEPAVTSIAAESSRPPTAGDVAEAFAAGFARRFRAKIRSRSLSPIESRAISVLHEKEFRTDWLSRRTSRSDLDRTAATPTLLGIFEVAFTLEQERFLREVQFSGDFIANSGGIDRLERGLRLCPADWRSVATIADDVFNEPENFILGIGKLRTIPDTIMKALAA